MIGTTNNSTGPPRHRCTIPRLVFRSAFNPVAVSQAMSREMVAHKWKCRWGTGSDWGKVFLSEPSEVFRFGAAEPRIGNDSGNDGGGDDADQGHLSVSNYLLAGSLVLLWDLRTCRSVLSPVS